MRQQLQNTRNALSRRNGIGHLFKVNSQVGASFSPLLYKSEASASRKRFSAPFGILPMVLKSVQFPKSLQNAFYTTFCDWRRGSVCAEC